MKKVIVSFLVIMLSINCCFINTKAAFSSGDGSKENPYVITTAEELDDVRNNLTSYFVLNNDIDLSSYTQFLPIGNNTTPFSGNFNGNGKKITGLVMSFEGNAFDLYNDKVIPPSSDDDYTQGTDNGWTGDYETGQKPDVENPEETVAKIPKYVGLFGVNTGEIFDLHIENTNITAKALNDEIFVGAFCGLNRGEIYRCYSSVSKVTSNATTDYCGGLIGQNALNGVVGNCFSNIKVKANNYAGGLVGLNKGYVGCSFYNGFDVNAQNVDAICNNSGTSQYNYYLESYLSSSTATKLTARAFSYSSYFTAFNFNSVWKINSSLKQPELKNNPYPVKQLGETAAVPQIESISGNIVTLKTDGQTLFSNDGIRWSKNNVFTQEYGASVKYYARKAETIEKYLGSVSAHLELTVTNNYDINGDGVENSKDLTTLRRYLADWDVFVVTENLDVNGDGSVSSKDATYLARYLAGWYI